MLKCLALIVVIGTGGKMFESINSGKSMVRAVVPINTNEITEINFRWTHIDTNVESFNLYYGPTSGNYTGIVENIRSNGFKFVKTNWNESHIRHYFTVSAFRYGLQSSNGPEIWWPPLDDSHIELKWVEIRPETEILAFGRLESKSRISYAKVPDTNRFVTNINFNIDSLFFTLTNNPGPLSIRGFNPTNNIIYGSN